MKLLNKALDFLSDSSGNMVIMAAITLPVLFIGIGATVSYSDATNRRIELQGHADIMSLGMAKKANAFNEADAIDYFNEYSSTQLDDSETCNYQLQSNPEQAVVNCSGEIPSFLSGFLMQKTVPYSVTATAALETGSIYEVAFVFDVSDSMVGEEIADLKRSLRTIADSGLFVDNDSRISLLPFANTVRLGPELEKFVTPGTGYAASGGTYNGCFDRNATDPNVNLNSNPTFPLVINALNNGRVLCPGPDMTAAFHRKATDFVVGEIERNIVTSFGTAMSDALVWGFRSLDPSLRGVMSSDSKYPLDNSSGTSKHIIMMTDGRPYDRPWNKGPGGGAVTQKLSLERFESVCSQLPFVEKNINFHLINYSNKKLSNEHLAVFKNCVSGEGEFHDVQAGGLASVISEITNQVSGLRLTQ